MTADEFAEVDEFIGAEVVGFRASPEVGAAGALLGGADAIAPIVAVGETASGITDDRGFDLAHVVDEIFADTVDVGDFGIAADPDAVVDDATEVFGEVAVDFRGDHAEGLVEEDFDAGVGRVGGEARGAREQKSSGGGGSVADEIAAVDGHLLSFVLWVSERTYDIQFGVVGKRFHRSFSEKL